ncbi:MAG: CRISPR-associated RAMP protein [Deltaproteobacteria bacterium]|nr:MAG: CRISPR-associated RAMP protein [Deltaproteobacteria bacterium]
MLKKLLNECRFSLQITTSGPLLVKSGYATPYGPDMTPVLTYRNNKEQVFIPGSSLKGVFRSHVEKVIRTLNEPAVCVLFDNTSCNTKLQDMKERLKRESRELTNETAYDQSCPACRLFGSMFFIGRVSIGDAYLTENADVTRYTEDRDGVGIDRFSGGAAQGAKFELKVIRAGVSFETDVYLRNFEIWQLGALMLVLQDMEDGLIRIGSGRSRGLGDVRGNVSQVDVQYIRPAITGKSAGEIWGLGRFLNGDDSYGTRSDDVLTLTEAPAHIARGIRDIQRFSEDSLINLKESAVGHFVQRVQGWE